MLPPESVNDFTSLKIERVNVDSAAARPCKDSLFFVNERSEAVVIHFSGARPKRQNKFQLRAHRSVCCSISFTVFVITLFSTAVTLARPRTESG